MNKGQLCVWVIVNPPHPPVRIPVKSPSEAAKLINEMAAIQLKDNDIHDNAFGLEEWDGVEWSEWYSEDGEDINDWEAQNEQFV